MRIQTFIFTFILGWILLYIGGWDLTLGTRIDRGEDFVFSKYIIAISVNDYFYGWNQVHRFFDSALISFMLFGAGVGSLTAVFWMTEDEDIEDNNIQSSEKEKEDKNKD